MSEYNSIRPFIGAKNFEESRAFYRDFGFTEVPISSELSFFGFTNQIGFYLQNAYVKDWVDNSMLFLEVEDLASYLEEIKSKKLTEKYSRVRLSEIVENDWGSEFFLHDPSGILWHIGNFKN